MIYIKKFESFQGSPLLNIENNVDLHLMNVIESKIKSGNILEISCGNGNDSLFLKKKGFNVKCTDINPDYCKASIEKGLDCINHDTNKKFPYNDNQFDLVYSRLGLHYFSYDELIKIFDEISRITKYMLITVKLTDNISTGKVILSSDLWIELISSKFTIEKSEVKKGNLYGIESTYLEVLAQANKF